MCSLFIYKTYLKPKGKPSKPRESHKNTQFFPDQVPRQTNRLKVVPYPFHEDWSSSLVSGPVPLSSSIHKRTYKWNKPSVMAQLRDCALSNHHTFQCSLGKLGCGVMWIVRSRLALLGRAQFAFSNWPVYAMWAGLDFPSSHLNELIVIFQHIYFVVPLLSRQVWFRT